MEAVKDEAPEACVLCEKEVGAEDGDAGIVAVDAKDAPVGLEGARGLGSEEVVPVGGAGGEGESGGGGQGGCESGWIWGGVDGDEDGGGGGV